MPAFDKVLNQTQIWQVAILLKNAGQPMPAEVTKLLQSPLDFGVVEGGNPAPAGP
jgi:hypothetical protein